MTEHIEPAELRRRCREADRWCASVDADPGYRTPALNPGLGDSPSGGQAWNATERLVAQRRALVGDTVRAEARGAVVVCAFLESVICGASAAASGGFFDEDDRPPWDTWLCVLPGESLLAWVPARDVARVQEGIAANPVECIYWLEDGAVRLIGPDSFEDLASLLRSARGSVVNLDELPDIEAPEMFASVRMPQQPAWFPLLLGSVAVIFTFFGQATFPTERGRWLFLGGVYAVLGIVVAVRQEPVQRLFRQLRMWRPR